MSVNDAALLAKATDGDLDALSTLLVRLGSQVRRDLSIAPKWQSVLDRDDIMQVTYVEAYLRIDGYQGNDLKTFVTWLRRIAKNNLLDAVKGLERDKRPPPDRRITSTVTDESYVGLCETLGATSTTPSRVAAGREIRQAVDRALDQLPPDYATVIRLYDLEERSGPDVGRTMGRSRGAVVMLLARARNRLREVLGAETQFFSRPA